MDARFLSLVVLTGCLEPIDDGSLAEETSNLSTTSWSHTDVLSPDDDDHGLGLTPAMASLDGFEYYVYSQNSFWNPLPTTTNDLSWKKCDPSWNCTDLAGIDDQQSLGRVSLAAFNGSIYMVHQGDSDASAVWFSKLNIATGRWTQNVKLSVSTHGGAPALAAFNGRLFMVGAREVNGTFPLWFTSMGTDEQWLPAQTMVGMSGSAVSLAVLDNTLYLAHRLGDDHNIAIQSLKPGGAWTNPALISAGQNGGVSQGDDIQLAAINGYLHLVHHRPGDSNHYWWTYNRGCDAWAAEVTIPAFNYTTATSMSAGVGRLVLNAMEDTGNVVFSTNAWTRAFFAPPPAPIRPPSCSTGIGGIGIGR